IYPETMQEVFADLNKIVVTNGAGGQNALPYLPPNELKPKASGTSSSAAGSNGNQSTNGGR
ncbi:MAG: protease modulator HflK, partial [Nitratireductor sp.]